MDTALHCTITFYIAIYRRGCAALRTADQEQPPYEYHVQRLMLAAANQHPLVQGPLVFLGGGKGFAAMQSCVAAGLPGSCIAPGLFTA